MKRISSALIDRRHPAHGVVLMVMLSLLGLFTVIAVTFVVASGAFRRGAAIAARVEQMGDPFEALIQQALMQVVRGSNNPQSAIGPHSLLEDIYGNSSSVAGVLQTPSSGVGSIEINTWMTPPRVSSKDVPFQMFLKVGGGISFGWDKQPGEKYVDDDKNGVVDDVSEAGYSGTDDVPLGQMLAYPSTYDDDIGNGKKNPTLRNNIVDNVDNYYAGRVITFISGSAAGQSCHILRSKSNNSVPGGGTVLYITTPENGMVPSDYDRYVINGRPFSGTGFGSTLPTGKGEHNLRMLDYAYNSPIDGGTYALSGKGVPIALTPNPVDLGYRNYLNSMAALVDANEDYDIADFQNMMLAHRQWNARTGQYETTAPSLHRPDLIAYFAQRSDLGYTPNPDRKLIRWTDIPPSVRRRIMLRPDPVDHYDYTHAGHLNPTDDSDGYNPAEPFEDSNGNGMFDTFVPTRGGPEKFEDLNGNGTFDAGDRPFSTLAFNAIDGPFDVDNDGDGVTDSIWVDIGLPVTTAPDGRLVKPLVAVMVLDLDGRINVNAHGSPKHYARTRELPDVLNSSQAATSGLYKGTDLINDMKLAPQNVVTRHLQKQYYTTEERYLVGAKAVAYRQTMGLSSTIQASDPIITSEMFPEYVSQNRWASSTEDDTHVKYDWPSLKRLYRNNYASSIFHDPVPWVEPAFGQGWSVADINLGAILASNDLAPSMLTTTDGNNPPQPKLSFVRYNAYRRLLEGGIDNRLPPPGRYGEVHLHRLQTQLSGTTGTDPIYYPGVGAVPRAGITYVDPALTAGLYPNSGPNMSADDNTPGMPNYSASPSGNTVIGNNEREEYNNGIKGDFVMPGDFDGNGALGLDYNGHPMTVQMGTSGETIDDPAEINLYRRYFPQMVLSGATTAGGGGNRAAKDAPFTPSELERVLRQRDPTAVALPDRLYDLVWNYDYEQYSLTTESWDLPCPHVAPTPELAGALRDLGLSVTHPSVGDLLRARFFLSHGSAISPDVTARLATIALRTYGWASNPPQTPLDVRRRQMRLMSPDLGLGLRMDINAPFGNGYDDDPAPNSGNGRYDPTDAPNTDPNGVVDEPTEWQLEKVSYQGGPINFDGNRDGNFYAGSLTIPAVAAAADEQARQQLAKELYSAADEQARQQLAKELYCLMMLLVDQNYVTPLPTAFAATGPGAPEVLVPPTAPTSGSDKLMPLYASNMADYAQHWLTARRLAQWAINVADFRDRDSIMSSFEFDADPFFDNDGDSQQAFDLRNPTSNVTGKNQAINGTWDVDGNVDVPTGATALTDDSTKPWRGVVWGCEYADLLLTETLAFHDRRTQNRLDDNGEQKNNDVAMTTITGTYKLSRCDANGNARLTDTSDPPLSYDRHWDQVRVPQGSAFFELYATGNPNLPASVCPREIYNVDVNNVVRLDLSRLVTDITTSTSYPVWRLAISEGRVQSNTSNGSITTLTQNDVAARLAANPATCSLDPADPGFSLLPWVNTNATTSDAVKIERVVVFCDDTVASGTLTLTAGLNLMTTGTTPWSTIDVFANSSGGGVAIERGEYVVIGPHRQNAGADNATPIGRTTQTGITVTTGGAATPQLLSHAHPQPVISLHPNGFIVTSPGGRNEYPNHTNLLAGVNTLSDAVNTAESPVLPTYIQIRPPRVVSCMTRATIGGDSERRVGLNVSEPMNADRPTVYSLTNSNRPLTIGTTSFVRDPVLNTADQLTSSDTNNRCDDLPWDGYMQGPISSTNDAVDPDGEIFNKQLDRLDDHTTLRYKSVFLQRLADPTRGWDRYTNPYLTLDWMPIDLTVFNGEPWGEQAEHLEHLREAGNIAARSSTGEYAEGGPLGKVVVRFGSRQRGAPRYPFKGNFSYLDLWGQPNYLDPGDPGGPTADFDTRPPRTQHTSRRQTVDGPDDYELGRYDYVNTNTDNEFFVKWQDPLIHTLGYLNESYHYRRRLTYGGGAAGSTTVAALYNPARLVTDPTVRPANRTQPDPDAAYGWLMEIDFRTNATTPMDPFDLKYVGAPWRPFNWMVWNNRPFAGAAELMLVPAVGPSRLLHEYDMRRTAIPSLGDNNAANRAPWESTRSGNHYLPYVAVNNVPGYVNRPPFGHLLNFFESSSATVTKNQTDGALNNLYPENSIDLGGSKKAWFTAGNFYRIFEFVTVPSRFSGTKQTHGHLVYNQARARHDGASGGGVTADAPAWPFTAPFNSIPRYREPGKVNINTMPLLAGDSSAVWRSVTNDFFPTQRYLVPRVTLTRFNTPQEDSTYTRANDRTSNIANIDSAPWNPSQTNFNHFHALNASLHSDDPAYDPRGPNALDDGGYGPESTTSADDDTRSRPMVRRIDKRRPSLFSNPFRSYMEGYGTVPTPSHPGGANPDQYSLAYSMTGTNGNNNPYLAVDSTMLRRRDTSWYPWQASMLPTDGTVGSLNKASQIDPAFDPLFTLNFPRPFSMSYFNPRVNPQKPDKPYDGPFSGYTAQMFYRWGYLKDEPDYEEDDETNKFGSSPFHNNVHSRDTDYRNTDRNPFFRYQLYTKLSNMATTRSNCYAIWVTLGYFEVERVNITSVGAKTLPSQESTGYSKSNDLPDAYRYPSGYRLLRELGSDTGETERHKAFAIFDRTIPVGFIRGENLNVDRAFLTRHILY